MGQNRSSSNSKLVVLGKFGAPFGVLGWLTVHSYTDPKDNILNFNTWIINKEDKISIKATKKFNNKLIVALKNITDRNQAQLLTNKLIKIYTEQLPKLPVNQYYWAELINLKVYNLDDKELGVVSYIFNNKANDIIAVKTSKNKEILIPYSFGDIIIDINQKNQTIIVDWKID